VTLLRRVVTELGRSGIAAPVCGAGVDVEVRWGEHDDPLRGVVRITQQGQRPVEQLMATATADTVRAVDSVIDQLPPASRALWTPFRSRA
jgi:hypothetical protein